ncbi:hypothetical protein INS49_006208 [Diaporthe citri]|uniref:uncharacterized protein n=1 Tax=Diaporthe citri TaxID=83186 RepID=UPI001C826651|nr:uncharacterized protein INS49_006208 [Diaporthe citri]KAG6364606.1 hypothetical protein INS49_006208 [Diaporthe citri]
MPLLPNEILDQIWLERCKLGFEPRILQPKWVNEGRFHVPAFYAAQPQAFMAQLCHGARAVAAKGFYSRISDNPVTGLGGFWWHEKDVLYVDQDFYRELRTPCKAIFMGRDYITRVAVDIQIDAGATAITELLLDWFPRLSQVFYLCSARLAPASQPWSFASLVSASSSRRWTYPEPPRSLRQPDPAGLGAKLRASVPRKERRYLTGSFHGYEKIPFFVFERDDRPQVISTGGSLNGDEENPKKSMTLEEVEDSVARRSRRFMRYIIRKSKNRREFALPS